MFYKKKISSLNNQKLEAISNLKLYYEDLSELNALINQNIISKFTSPKELAKKKEIKNFIRKKKRCIRYTNLKLILYRILSIIIISIYIFCIIVILSFIYKIIKFNI